MTISTYAELRASVQSALARTDIPTFVYDLATAEINARLRVVEMETETTLTCVASQDYVALPAGFLELRSAYIDTDPRRQIDVTTAWGVNDEYRESGVPTEGHISAGRLYLNPVPDSTYSIAVRYFASLAPFSADADTNDVLARYPGVYHYGALKHASAWAMDAELAGVAATMFEGEIKRARDRAISERYPGPLRRRAAAVR